MSMNTVVVGYGKSLNSKLFHCNAIKATEGLKLYGVCAKNPMHKEEVKRNYNCKFYTSFKKVLEDDKVNLVAIATPSYLHAEMILQALNAKKHVVVEKPMCLKVSEADEMIKRSEHQNRILTVRQNRRWDPDFLTMKNVLVEEKLGKVFLLHIAYTDLLKPSGWRKEREKGGGVLYDLGPHLIDQALQLILSEPVSVYAFMGNWGGSLNTDMYARLLLKFQSGVFTDIELSHISWIPKSRWYAQGDRGSLSYKNGMIYLRTDAGESAVTPVPSDQGGFYQNVSDVLNRDAKLAVTPHQISKVIRIIEAAFLSAETGKVVDLRTFTPSDRS